MRVDRIGRPPTPLDRTLASIHSWQTSPGMNPREILHIIDRMIAERLWEGETDEAGRPMTLGRALGEPWPTGVGLSLQRLERVYEVASDADVDPALIDRVKRGIDGVEWPRRGEVGPGRVRSVIDASHGKASARVRARLARDHPELYERVLAGELSVYAAAVEAGFARRTRTIPIDSPEAAIRALLRVFGADELRRALDEAEDEPEP